ncbi:MAG: hypothetical protein M3P26_04440 [Gemmatimonadota bacterium]|nr:hypothetical protein [Gemmatimonadota bacterium]
MEGKPKDTLKSKTRRTGRYDLATKVEVEAFVGSKMKRLADAIEEEIIELRTDHSSRIREHADAIIDLRARMAELELTTWQRLKRAIADWRDRMQAPVLDRLPSDGGKALAPDLLDDDLLDLESQSAEIAEAIRAIEAQMLDESTPEQVAQRMGHLIPLHPLEYLPPEAHANPEE